MNANVKTTSANFIYSPEGSGIPPVVHAPAPWPLNAQFDPLYFPDLSQATVLGVARMSDFEMEFPVSTLLEGTD